MNAKKYTAKLYRVDDMRKTITTSQCDEENASAAVENVENHNPVDAQIILKPIHLAGTTKDGKWTASVSIAPIRQIFEHLNHRMKLPLATHVSKSFKKKFKSTLLSLEKLSSPQILLYCEFAFF